MVSPARRRDAVGYLTRRHRISERRACKLVGQHRSTQRYRPEPPEFELALVRRMNELAELHPRYGSPRICALLKAEGFAVNHKRIERLWRAEGHRIAKAKSSRGKRAFGSSESSAWNLRATKPNDIWSYDFVMTRSSSGKAIRILNIVDEFTRRSVGLKVAHHIGTRGVTEALVESFRKHGRPGLLRSDNGREFISQTLTDWLSAQGVDQAFIEKGTPQQNPFVERFNGTMRDEVLNGEFFHNILEARAVLGEWVEQYNNHRPHRGLGMKTPQEYYEGIRVVGK